MGETHLYLHSKPFSMLTFGSQFGTRHRCEVGVTRSLRAIATYKTTTLFEKALLAHTFGVTAREHRRNLFMRK
jgi:hypothetical protein